MAHIPQDLSFRDQCSSQRFLGITADSSTPIQSNTQSASSGSSHLRCNEGICELRKNRNVNTAPLKMAFVIGPPKIILTTMPLWMLSHWHTAGTPTIRRESAYISSVRVLTRLQQHGIPLPTPRCAPVRGLEVDKRGSYICR